MPTSRNESLALLGLAAPMVGPILLSIVCVGIGANTSGNVSTGFYAAAAILGLIGIAFIVKALWPRNDERINADAASRESDTYTAI